MRVGPGDDEGNREEEDLFAPEEDDDGELEGEPTRRIPQPVPED